MDVSEVFSALFDRVLGILFAVCSQKRISAGKRGGCVGILLLFDVLGSVIMDYPFEIVRIFDKFTKNQSPFFFQ
jgi:hypothetical protein